MRDAIEAWGRARYPGARVVHELVVGQNRLDMAFVQRDHIAGVEIKSSKDKLDRLDRQMRVFADALPEVWLAIAPKWLGPIRALDGEQRVPNCVGVVLVEDGAVISNLPSPSGYSFPSPATIDRAKTTPLLGLLWKSELLSIGRRNRLDVAVRDTMSATTVTLCRRLTGDEIVQGACRELRARRAFWRADDPIIEEGQTLAATPDLYRSHRGGEASL